MPLMNVDELRRFIGNPAAYALQVDDGYRPVRKTISSAVLKQHLSGEVTVGTYVNVGDAARFVVFDVDTGDDAKEQADRVTEAVLGYGIKPYAVGLEFSGRKGYHVWVLLDDYRPASELRRFGRGVTAIAEVECEVFPKQDEVRDLGNLVKLPGGVHRVSGTRSSWETDVPYPMNAKLWEDKVVPLLPPELVGRRAAGTAAERFPCMDAIQSEGCTSDRNNQLFHLATMLRRAGLTQEYVAQVVTSVNEKGSPLDEFEVQQLLRSAEMAGPLCDSVPEARKCGELCIRTRTAGLYTRPRQLRHAAVGENVVVTLASRAGNTVTLEHDDLQTAKGVLRDGG